VRAQLDGTRANLQGAPRQDSREADAIKAGMRLDLEEFVKEFSQRLPEEIDRADADDVKRYLSPFLQDTWKDWAEQEGEKIAERLERLAEEIIQVTNENVAEAMATLREELGPADARIDLEVDSLKVRRRRVRARRARHRHLPVREHAVGRALTLAAPIIAVLVKERVSGAVKRRRRRSSRSDSTRPAARWGRSFEQIVDDFKVRLADFVTARAMRLHRGIGEVLDRALAERPRPRGRRRGARQASSTRRSGDWHTSKRASRRCARSCGNLRPTRQLADQLGELIVPDDVRAHVELGAAYLDARRSRSARS
jgi:hypothetical protein